VAVASAGPYASLHLAPDREPMDKVDKECLMIRMSVSGCMFLLVLAHAGSPVQRAVDRLCVCV